MTQKISEQTVLLGRRQSLVGIVARAVTGAPPDNPAVIILNTGIIHRVGHHRMYVTMSRALAAAGHTVLRFDFSGIGDSDPRTDGLAPVESCLADIKDAIDWLERDREVSRVILIGLCSGADYAILYGHTDARVVALVLMDPRDCPVLPAYHYPAAHAFARLEQSCDWPKSYSQNVAGAFVLRTAAEGEIRTDHATKSEVSLVSGAMLSGGRRSRD